MRSTSCGAEGRRRHGPPGERGATVVEFLGVAVLAAVALMVVVQFSLWVWTRNVVVNAADEGARLAAEAGQPLATGADRTRSVLHDGLGSSASRFAVGAANDGRAVVIRVEGVAPSVVPFLPDLPVRTEARAFDEDQARPR